MDLNREFSKEYKWLLKTLKWFTSLTKKVKTKITFRQHLTLVTTVNENPK